LNQPNNTTFGGVSTEMEKTLKLKPATGTDPGPAAENTFHRAMQTVPNLNQKGKGQDCTRFEAGELGLLSFGAWRGG